MEEITIEYTKLQKRYNLPDFSVLDKEFDISSIEKDNFLLRNIIDKIIDKLTDFSCVLESLLQPDSSSLRSLIETAFFDENEKKEQYALYKKIMMISRKRLELSLEPDEKKEAEFIIRTIEEWKNIKKIIQPHIKKLSDSWNKEVQNKEVLGYLG